MKELKISVERPDATLTVLRLEGDFEGVSAANAGQRLMACLEECSTPGLMMDFQDISYIDSAAIGILLQMATAAAKRKIKLGLLNVHDPVLKVLAITKVDKIFTIYGKG